MSAGTAASAEQIVGLERPPPEHDVVAKCRNGKLKRATGDVYVVMRVTLAGRETDADAVAYSYDPDFGTPFVEQIACRELYGRFWDHKKEGSPCFDPFDDDGNEVPPPVGRRFMMWDAEQDEFDSEGMPVTPTPSLTVYDVDGEPMRRYKIARVQLTINDLMAIETEGDRFFQ